MKKMIKLKINGENKEYQDELTIQQLLQSLNLEPDRVVVELNREILSLQIHDKTKLKSGDTIELVQFVGGG